MKKYIFEFFSCLIIVCIIFTIIDIAKNDGNLVLSAVASTENDFTYKTEKLKVLYEDSISIKYPKFASKSKDCKKINTIIEKELFRYLNLHGTDFENLIISIDYSVEILNNSFVCISFFGESNSLSSAHPNNIFFSINYLIEKNEKVRLRDVVKIDNSLVKSILKASEKENTKILNDYLNEINNENLIEILEDENLQFVISKKHICIVLNIPHALGDFMKITIPLDEITGQSGDGSMIDKGK